ncbi:MAG: hypothetical protein C0391_01170 [Anaerolinea sp.]|nr:hypothetical protein [Anaerolinea sp.]
MIQREQYAYSGYQLFWEALDWLFPPTCSGCGVPGVRWCNHCESKLNLLPDLVCDCCGIPAEGNEQCDECSNNPPSFSSIRSQYSYEGEIREALHALKYKNDLGIGEILASKSTNFLQKLGWKIDLIVPVPLGRARLKERGYNQAAMIAYPIALKSRIPYHSRILKRSRETISQVDLSAENRKVNVKDAFHADTNMVEGRSVLVVDDIITTGATMEESARALKAAGATSIYGLSVARAMLVHRYT